MYNELKKFLYDKGISQAELSQVVDMTPQNFSRMIKNGTINGKKLAKLATYLNVDLGFISKLILLNEYNTPTQTANIFEESEAFSHIPPSLKSNIVRENVQNVSILGKKYAQDEEFIGNPVETVKALKIALNSAENNLKDKQEIIDLLKKENNRLESELQQLRDNKSAKTA